MNTSTNTTRRGFLGKLGMVLGGLTAVGAFTQTAQAGRSRFRYYGGYGYGYPRRSAPRYYRPQSRVRYYGAPYGGGYYSPGYYGNPYAPAPYAPVYPSPYGYPQPGGVFLRLNGPGRPVANPLSLLEA